MAAAPLAPAPAKGPTAPAPKAPEGNLPPTTQTAAPTVAPEAAAPQAPMAVTGPTAPTAVPLPAIQSPAPGEAAPAPTLTEPASTPTGAESAPPVSLAVAALSEDPTPKAAPLKALPTPTALPAPSAAPVAPATGSSAAGSDPNGPGTGAQAPPKAEAGRPPALVEKGTAPEATAAGAKAAAPDAAATKADPARPEAPRVEGAKPPASPGFVREMIVAVPAAAPVAAAGTEFKVPTSPVVNQVETTLRWMVKGPVPEAKLQLHPENLGKVSIELKVSEGQVHAKVWVQEPAALQALQDGRANLEQALKQSGLQLGSFDLQQGGEASHHAPEPRAQQASGPKGDSALPTARQEAPAPSPARAANPRRIELYV
ncbi:MAG TPA: flagellar hook-length control protein FliK [Holophagaceae bacterium]|nr:flagellar hook-length control protein FliK [Holophagaceae bacterium]